MENIGPSAELRGVYDEYESLRYFENELNRLITAFANEAREPLIELLCRIEPWNTSTVTRPSMTSLAQGIRQDAAAGKDEL